MTHRPPLLLLCHRIPYPPNKGDKIRSFHLLKHLAKRYRVCLGAFVDDLDDWRHAATLRNYCDDLMLRPLSKSRALGRLLMALPRRQALTLAMYADPGMTAWVRQRVETLGIRHALAFSSATTQFLEPFPQLCRVADMVDVDSEKWRQYAGRRPWPLSLVFRREARLLLDYEKRLAERFGATTLVSVPEQQLFARLAPNVPLPAVVENGIDADYFSGGHDFPNPYQGDGPLLVFVGRMDYWPNIDAVTWFCQAVWPAVRQRVPSAQFAIVGAAPSVAVRRLADAPGVLVTGAVDDVRPYLAHASASVAPLRVARGVQNKVLEAMAMAKPVLCSPEAAEGLVFPEDGAVMVLGHPQAWIEAAVEILTQPPDEQRARRNRAFVLGRYDWERCLAPLDRLLGSATAGEPG